MGHRYLENCWVLNLWSINNFNSNLTDADDDIEKLAEEEAKGVFVEFIVDMLTVVDH